jgi:RNA polymerase sigma-70 factor, ECF subfamily
MKQDDDRRGLELERFRDFLALFARMQTDRRLQARIDLSGVVQQTLLEAFQAGAQLEGCTDAQKAAWLREALTHNLHDEVRKLHSAKRDVRREQPLEVSMQDSMARLEQLLPATFSTPSRQFAREEGLLRVAQALAQLPENQRQVIEEHHLRGRTLAEVAELLGTTKPAVAGLLHRGLKRLRELLATDETVA